MAETLKEAALGYVSRGWSVFPLKERDKVPAVLHGRNSCTDDRDTVRDWWEAHPAHNIGVATGTESMGLVVIDFDVKDDGTDGTEYLRKWEKEHGELPETVTAVTGSGGYHMFYQVDTNVSCSTCSDHGVDIRGEGGYVVAPPSIHPKTGRRYEWENHPEDYDVARADDNVMAFIASVQPRGSAESGAYKPPFELPARVVKGERNDKMMRYAASLQSQSYPDPAIRAMCEMANIKNFDPPLDDHELSSIIKSVMRWPKGRSIDVDKLSKDVYEERSTEVTLVLNSRGKPLQEAQNFYRVLQYDARLAGKFWYDKTSYTKMVSCPVPWDPRECDRQLRDSDYSGFEIFCEYNYGLTSSSKGKSALQSAIYADARNPMVDWLDSLKWDGDPWLETIGHMFLGSELTDYNIAAMRLFVVAAVARMYEPGIKFDNMLVLVGRQGLGKSTFLRRLACDDSRYCDALGTIEGDVAVEKLRGMWIVEMAELLATKSMRGVESIKSFLSTQIDVIRPKYGRETEQRPRVCVFAGTTNSMSFLTDKTGNRRFLSIMCGVEEPERSMFDDDCLPIFEQAVAQAVHIWKTERPALVMPSELSGEIESAQERFTEDDPRVGMIQQYLDEKSLTIEDINAPSSRVCVMELWERVFGGDPNSMPKYIINEFHDIMRNEIDGWIPCEKKQRTASYGVQRCYMLPCDGALRLTATGSAT